MVIYFIDLLL